MDMQQDKTMEFMAIAMKYLPEAQAKLAEAGIQFSMELAEPFMDLFKKVMYEAYELGKKDAQEDQ
jgi:competence protein ComZ